MTTQSRWRANPDTIDVNNYHIVNGRRNDEGYTLYRLEGYAATPRQPRVKLEDIAGDEDRIIFTSYNGETDQQGCPAGTTFDVEEAREFVEETYSEGQPVNESVGERTYFYDPNRPIRLRLSGMDIYNIPIRTISIRFRDGNLSGRFGPRGTEISVEDLESSTGSHMYYIDDVSSPNYEGPGFFVVDATRPSSHERNDQTMSFRVNDLGTDYRFTISAENSVGLSANELFVRMLPDTLCVAEP
ncbi:MAG: hypothetical protein AAF583_14165 [Pseudomonadota bacterium]